MIADHWVQRIQLVPRDLDRARLCRDAVGLLLDRQRAAEPEVVQVERLDLRVGVVGGEHGHLVQEGLGGADGAGVSWRVEDDTGHGGFGGSFVVDEVEGVVGNRHTLAVDTGGTGGKVFELGGVKFLALERRGTRAYGGSVVLAANGAVGSREGQQGQQRAKDQVYGHDS